MLIGVLGKGANPLFSGRLEQEYEILTIIRASRVPLGSGTIRDSLIDRGLQISEATVGRILRDLDKEGWTKRVGYRGRILTSGGKERLKWLLAERERAIFSGELLKALRAKGKEKLVDVLVARRAIERETARLAALHATEEELTAMEGILAMQRELLGSGQSTAATDVKFHRSIAVAAQNRVLVAAIDLIRQDGQLTPIMEYIRRRVGSTMVADHMQILARIAARDAQGAEEAMVAHIDGLITDVGKYWDGYEGE